MENLHEIALAFREVTGLGLAYLSRVLAQESADRAFVAKHGGAVVDADQKKGAQLGEITVLASAVNALARARLRCRRLSRLEWSTSPSFATSCQPMQL